MKIEFNGKEIMALTELQEKVFQYDMLSATYKDDLIRDMQWIINEKVDRCYDRLKAEWTPKLIEAGATTIPLKREKFAEEVFKHEHYKNRSVREKELELKRAADIELASRLESERLAKIEVK